MSSLLGPDSTVGSPKQCLISRFKFDDIITREAVAILGMGPRNCGKTTFVEKYCEVKLKQDPEHIVVMVDKLVDLGMNPCSQENIDRMKDAIKSYVHGQKAILATQRDAAKNISIIIDGLQSHQFSSIKDELREILMINRHLKISLVITSTYLPLPADFRTNIDYLVAWPPKNRSGSKRLHDNWFFNIPNFSFFDQFINALEPGVALVSDHIKAVTKWYSSFDAPGSSDRQIMIECRDKVEARNIIRADSLGESNKIKLLELQSLLRRSVKLIESITSGDGDFEILTEILRI